MSLNRPGKEVVDSISEELVKLFKALVKANAIDGDKKAGIDRLMSQVSAKPIPFKKKSEQFAVVNLIAQICVGFSPELLTPISKKIFIDFFTRQKQRLDKKKSTNEPPSNPKPDSTHGR